MTDKKIITEIKDEHNKELMDFCFQNEKNQNILYIPSEKWLSRITAQASRQPGFSVIATEILNYDNDEIYFSKIGKELIGKTFKEISPMEIVTQAAQRQQYIDQSQSLNLNIPPTMPVRDVNKVLIEAWKLGDMDKIRPYHSAYYPSSSCLEQALYV